jgi:peptidoglycan/LPS O-acetylase OafA/YrhL
MHENNFHFIRFFAAVLVIYGHAYPLTGRSNYDDLQVLTGGLFPTAHMGVCIFFSISGYLITKSLLTSKSYLSFVWKRLVRLMPGLLVATLFTVFVIGPIATSYDLGAYFNHTETYAYLKSIKMFPVYPDTLPGVFENLPYTSVNGSLWTLAYEVSCYAGLLGVYMLLQKHTKYLLLVVFVVLWCSYTYWVRIFEEHPVILRFIHLNLSDLLNFGMYFLAGAIICFFQTKIPYRLGWVLALLVAQLFVYWGSSVKGFFPLSANVMLRYLLVPYVVLYLGFLKGWMNRFGNMGDLSYGLYIYAFPVQQLIVSYFWPEMLSIPKMFLYSLLLTLPLSWLSWKLIEAPSLKLKKL